MASIEAATAAVVDASPSMQNTVLRMRTGGSAGLRTMIALPRCAPPSSSSPGPWPG